MYVFESHPGQDEFSATHLADRVKHTPQDGNPQQDFEDIDEHGKQDGLHAQLEDPGPYQGRENGYR